MSVDWEDIEVCWKKRSVRRIISWDEVALHLLLGAYSGPDQ